METIRMSELAWPDYDRRVKDGAMVLVPVGALEQHGPHMSMNPDVLLPTAIAERVAANVRGLVAPAIAYGYKSQQQSGGGNHMPGNTCLDGQTMISLVRDVLRELARHNGHADILRERLDEVVGLRTPGDNVVEWTPERWTAYRTRLTHIADTCQGGTAETS